MPEPTGQPGDRVQGADRPRGGLHLRIGGLRPTVGDVVPDAADEQVRFLGHNAEPSPIGAHIEQSNVGEKFERNADDL